MLLMLLKSLWHLVLLMHLLTSHLNGQYLRRFLNNSSAAMSAAVSADFGTDTATLQTKLNTLMTTLNGVHPSLSLSILLMNLKNQLHLGKGMEAKCF